MVKIIRIIAQFSLISSSQLCANHSLMTRIVEIALGFFLLAHQLHEHLVLVDFETRVNFLLGVDFWNDLGQILNFRGFDVVLKVITRFAFRGISLMNFIVRNFRNVFDFLFGRLPLFIHFSSRKGKHLFIYMVNVLFKYLLFEFELFVKFPDQGFYFFNFLQKKFVFLHLLLVQFLIH